jgi:S1-C subfamily serine protease
MNKPFSASACVLIFAGAVIGGCAPYFSYDGINYSSSEEAKRAMETDIQKKLGGVVQSETSFPASLDVVVPTREIIRQNGVVIYSGEPSESMMAYVTDSLELGFLSVHETVKRGDIFARTSLSRRTDSANCPVGDADYKLWLAGLGPNQWQWYLSPNNCSKNIPINADAALVGSARLNSINAAVIAGTEQLGAAASRHETQGRGEEQSVGAIGRSGTGFFVNDGGFAVTNAHVAADCSRLTMSHGGNDVSSVTFIAADNQNDLALLKVSGVPQSHGDLRSSPAIRRGEQILIYGYPLAGALASTGNVSTGIITALAGLGDDTGSLQISAPVQPGNSGGPVVDESGLIVGVVQSKLDVLRAAAVTGDIAQNVNFAIKVSVLMSFLDANGVVYKTSTSQQRLSTADLSDKAQAFTFNLRCTQ